MALPAPLVNRERGEVAFDMRGRWLVLRFDYDAIGRMVSEIGEDFSARFGIATVKTWDVQLISKMLVIAARRHHPELTEAMVMEASPPYDVTVKAIADTFHAFRWGSSPEPQHQISEGEETERPLSRGSRLFGGLFRMRRAAA